MTAGDAQRSTGHRSWAMLPLLWLIRAYQLVVSPLLGQRCRYYPSCSSYAMQALREHGVLRGSWLAARRLSRCHPWSPGGVDHVPVAGDGLDRSAATAEPSQPAPS